MNTYNYTGKCCVYLRFSIMTKLEDMQQLLEYLKSKQHGKELSENMLFAMYTILLAKDGGAKAFMAIADNDIEQSHITDGMSEELTEQINTLQGNWTRRGASGAFCLV